MSDDAKKPTEEELIRLAALAAATHPSLTPPAIVEALEAVVIMNPRRLATQVKQVLVVRKDLNMRKGKIAAQGAHASMKVLLDAMKQNRVQHFNAVVHGGSTEPYESYTDWTLRVDDGTPLELWLNGSFAKICVSVNSEAELDAVYEKAQAAGILSSIIIDSGRTEFHGQPTKTVVAIGPDWSDKIDPITGGLPLL